MQRREFHMRQIEDGGLTVWGTTEMADFWSELKNNATHLYLSTLLKSCFDRLPIGILISDATGRSIDMNAAASRLLDLPEIDGQYSQIDDLAQRSINLDRTALPLNEFPITVALRERRTVENCYIGIVTSEGTVHWLAVTATPLEKGADSESTSDGMPPAILSTYTEIQPSWVVPPNDLQLIQVLKPCGVKTPSHPSSQPSIETDDETVARPLKPSPRSDPRLERILECLLGFTSQPRENVRRLVRLAQELIGGQCACYQTFDRNVSIDNLTSPSDCFQCSICHDRDCRSSRELAPCHFLKQPAPTRLSQLATCESTRYGRLCIAYPDGRTTRGQNSDDLHILHTIATAIAVEEDRLRVAERLHQQAEREVVIARLAGEIRQSLQLSDILQSATDSLRRFLRADRTIVYRFNTGGCGDILSESRTDDVTSMLEWKLNDPWIIDRKLYQKHLNGQVMAVRDIYKTDLVSEVIQLLEFFEIRSQLVVPIFIACESTCKTNVENGVELWGLLIAHQCRESRQWQSAEIELLPQLATQLSIAIQQSLLYERLELANQELSELAIRDGLTQVANRRCFDEYLDREWRRLTREQAPLSLVLLDIDFFKGYNDRYGHQAGDECLKRLAWVMQKATRRPADLVARYGGEEFAIVLPNTDKAGAVCVADMLRSGIYALHVPHESSGVSRYVTASLGVATMIPFPEADADLLVAAADRALYKAKQKGRNRYCVAKSIDA